MKGPKPEMPDDPLADQSPEALMAMLNKMSREELDKYPYIEKWWTCAAQGCERRTTVRDYGHPWVIYWRRRFINITHNCFLCGLHYPIERAFLKSLNRNDFEVADLVTKRPFEFKAVVNSLQDKNKP